MKKIFLMLFAICAFAACDPIHEEIGNSGHITLEELLSKTTVTVDKAASGLNGNVISCETFAPVNATWDIGGKLFVGTAAKKKMKVGEYKVTLTALCADGQVLVHEFTGIKCDEITDPLQKIYIYGEDPTVQPPFVPENWNSNNMRFSDNEGAHFPFLSDEVYWGYKTLVIDVSGASDDLTVKVMSGWWDNVNVDDQHWTTGLNELPLTEDIAKVCAKGNGGNAHDLTFMVTSGTCTVNSVYYEE